MSRLFKISCFVCLCLTLLATRAWSDDPKPAAGAQPSQDEMMKMMMELGKPGPVHQTIASLAGNWDVENKFSPGPGAPEQTEKGKCSNKTILGGRFLCSEFKGEMMGMPFEGTGLLGYDNAKKKPVCTWSDSMTTGIMYAEGECSADGKSMTFKYEMDMGPMGKSPVRFVYTIASADKYTFDWYETRDGKEAKTMTITYTRAK